ncbi:MAG TPA: CoA pyrophosphatase [bacterium]
MNELIDLVRRRLRGRRRLVIDDPRMRRAAVLLPLFEEQGDGYVLFTRRTDTVEHHKGQISLPGGSEDASDAGPLATALRETEEELGIPPDRVEILGMLDDVYTVVSGFVITPFVGVIPHPMPLRVNPHEIAEVLTVPISTFREPGRLRVEEREREGERIKVYFYYHGQHEIWGATGRIMKDFVDVVFGEEEPS